MIALLMLAVTPAGFAPLAPLVGHCWRGELPGGAIDTHCFAWTARRTAVRDRHVVEKDGKAVYRGETDYTLDGERLRWAYRNADGPVMAGEITAAPNGLSFSRAGKPLIWEWRGRRAYVAPTGPRADPVRFTRVR